MAANSDSGNRVKSKANDRIRRRLTELGSEEEKVLYRGRVDKFNNRGAKQSRLLVITNQAMYNFKGIFSKTCKRCIDIKLIEYILRSKFSNEFILCIPQGKMFNGRIIL
ncbi:hypothetical protein O6H91_14G009000 [Diphasiastrum complanatum]|uniref:Uncharacterized protein n=1 Tax=Diphasiastrum complanatum TaxID=34168 RepID=A0ACC2BLG4_DIPCM|nr:hypothetical protein O6H91_14G009000 [Diphasiastrum complanatum]